MLEIIEQIINIQTDSTQYLFKIDWCGMLQSPGAASQTHQRTKSNPDTLSAHNLSLAEGTVNFSFYSNSKVKVKNVFGETKVKTL